MPEELTPAPDGFNTVNLYLIVDGADRLIDFLKQAFGAVELSRSSGDDGVVRNAAVRIGDSAVEVSEARPPFGAMTAAIHLYLADTDVVYRRALDAGATSLYEPADMFYGERSGGVMDAWGNHWYIATRTEQLSREEMQRREKAFLAQQKG